MSDVTRKGEKLISEWLGSQEAEQRAKEAKNRAECSLKNAERALAKWLMPSDMKEGEKIAVWMGDSLFQVELLEGYEPKVSVRSRGKRFHELAVA